MIRDFFYRLIAVFLLAITFYGIYIIGWKFLTRGATAANIAEGAPFTWYSFVISNFHWIILGVFLICILVLFFYMWDRKN